MKKLKVCYILLCNELLFPKHSGLKEQIFIPLFQRVRNLSTDLLSASDLRSLLTFSQAEDTNQGWSPSNLSDLGLCSCGLLEWKLPFLLGSWVEASLSSLPLGSFHKVASWHGSWLPSEWTVWERRHVPALRTHTVIILQILEATSQYFCCVLG